MGVKLLSKNRRRGLVALGDDGMIPGSLIPGGGVANPFPDQILDNADTTHPVKVGFEIDNTRTVSDIILTVYTEYFRAYASGVPSGGSTSASAGGSSTPTTSSGGGYTNPLEGSHAHNWSHGGHTHSLQGHDHGISTSGTSTSYEDPTSTHDHVHYYQLPSAWTGANWGNTGGVSSAIQGITDFQGNHQHTIPAHDHTVTIGTHQHTNPAHTHEIEYGIYEYESGAVNYYAPVKLYINDSTLVTNNAAFGTKGTENARADVEMSLIALYTGVVGVDTIGDGENTFYILPVATANNAKGLVRISATVTIAYTDGGTGVTVSSCSDSTRWNGKIMPLDAAGALTNDGAGTLSWQATASPLPADAHGLLHNDGAGTKTWLDETNFAAAGHNHDAAYSAIGHNHDAAYLGIGAKAADSDLLDGHDTAYFAEAGHNHDAAYLGIHATADDSTEWDGKAMPADVAGVLTNDGAGVLTWEVAASPLPPDAVGALINDGAGNLSWDPAAGGGWDWGPNNDNLLINGNFDVWQRATFSTGDVNGLIFADRWLSSHVGATSTSVSMSLFTLGQTDVPGNPKYYETITFTAGANVNNYFVHSQKIEHVNTGAGDAVTVSFYAKANANKSVAIEIEQKFGTGGSPSASVQTLVGKYNIGTNWTYVTGTVTLPSITGKTLGSGLDDCLQLNIWLDAGSNFNSRTSSLGHQSGTFDIASVKLEYGDTATGLIPVPYTQELQACQRFYCYVMFCGMGFIVNGLSTTIPFPVNMRASPTIEKVKSGGGTLNRLRNTATGGEIVFTSPLAATNHNGGMGCIYSPDSNNVVVGQSYDGYAYFSAEL